MTDGLPDSWQRQVDDELHRTKAEREQERQLRIANLKSELGISEDKSGKASFVQQALQVRDAEWSKRRRTLHDDLFIVAQGALQDEHGDPVPYERVSGQTGEHFDAHGIAKDNQFENLIELLDHGISASKSFYSAPFEAPVEIKQGLGAALGTSDGTAYKHGIAVVTSGYGEKLSHGGIKHVFINDVFGAMLAPLAKAYPQYQFSLLSEQKSVLEEDAQRALAS